MGQHDQDDGLRLQGDRPPEIRARHLERLAVIYIRQSTTEQVRANIGSTEAQRGLIELPRRWGWPDARIRVVEDDLGLSGTSITSRTGLRDLLAWIDQGEVGLVVVRDVTRLSRDPLDSEIFLRKAINAGVLISANGRLFDAATKDLADLFGLRIQALLGWLENEQRVRMLQGAKTAKVRLGFAVTRPPVGYVESRRGHWILDPDLQVQHAIRRVFAFYQELRSVGKVVKAFRRAGLLFPRRQRGELRWEPITRDRVYDLLTNEHYTGAYVFRRYRGYPPARRNRYVMRSDAPERIEAHHDGYITQQEYQANQADLAARRPAVRPPVGDGSALLQGLLTCGRCGRWMNPVYQNRAPKGHPLKRLPHYKCDRADAFDHRDHFLSCVAAPLDQGVVRRVLSVLTPVTLDIALGEVRAAQAAEAEVCRAQNRALRRAEDEVEDLRARHGRVAAEHGRVKVDLEAQYDAALARLETLRGTIAAAASTAPRIVTEADIAALLALTQRLPHLWETATNEERKQLLRMVLTRITLTRTAEAFDLELEWVGGLREPLRVLRPQGVAVLAVERARAGQHAFAIARELNAQGLGNVSGRPLTGPTVQHALKRRGVLSKAERIAVLQRIRTLVLEGRTRPEILAVIQREAPPRLGPWRMPRLRDAISRLRDGVLGIPPLPTMPADDTRDPDGG
jgi:DNA invertase Pin-like site-specific DNA recombinase